MIKKLKKEDILTMINSIFLKNSSKKEIKKLKRLSMSKNIKLGNLRKKFCKKCLAYFTSETSEIRIKKHHKTVRCKNCGYISRWKIKMK